MISYYEYLAKNGGIATVGGHLAVMISPRKNVNKVPAGWGFIALKDATPERVQSLVDEVKKGRSNWPKAQTWTSDETV